MLYMRNKILCHRNEKKINKKFIWLKVALVNISHSTIKYLMNTIDFNKHDINIFIHDK